MDETCNLAERDYLVDESRMQAPREAQKLGNNQCVREFLSHGRSVNGKLQSASNWEGHCKKRGVSGATYAARIITKSHIVNLKHDDS